jgi:hypothetical protein
MTVNGLTWQSLILNGTLKHRKQLLEAEDCSYEITKQAVGRG